VHAVNNVVQTDEL